MSNFQNIHWSNLHLLGHPGRFCLQHVYYACMHSLANQLIKIKTQEKRKRSKKNRWWPWWLTTMNEWVMYFIGMRDYYQVKPVQIHDDCWNSNCFQQSTECMLLAEHSVIMLLFKIIANSNWVYFQLINIIKKKLGRVDFRYLIDSKLS